MHSNRVERWQFARRSWALAALVLSAFVLASGTASAQWLPDRVLRDGDGFRTARTEIHTSFAAEGGVDSNVFLQSVNPTLAGIMRLTGGVFIRPRRVTGDGDSTGTTDESQHRNIDFNFGLSASYYHYFTHATRDNLSGTVNASVHFRPMGKIGFELREAFTRTVRPFTDATSNSGSSISYGQNVSATTANITFRSPGDVIQGNVGYTANITLFDSSLFSGNNSIEHRVATRLAWTFFPRTALVYEGTASFRSYGVAATGSAYSALVSSRRTTASVGVNGILSAKLSLTLMAGYTAGFFLSGSDYDGLIARAELRFRPRAGVTLTAGYSRDTQPSYIGNFTRMDTGYLNTEMAFGGRFLVGSQLSAGRGRSGLATLASGGFLGNYQQRVDTRILARIYSEYRATNWLAVTLSLEYVGDLTDFSFATPPGSGSTLPDPAAQYQRLDAWLGARFYH